MVVRREEVMGPLNEMQQQELKELEEVIDAFLRKNAPEAFHWGTYFCMDVPLNKPVIPVERVQIELKKKYEMAGWKVGEFTLDAGGKTWVVRIE